jgi:hypothetical protein
MKAKRATNPDLNRTIMVPLCGVLARTIVILALGALPSMSLGAALDNLSSIKPIRLGAGRGLMTSITLDPDGTILAALGANGIVYFWDLRTLEELESLDTDQKQISFSPDWETLVSYDSATGIMSLWDVAARTKVGEIQTSSSVAAGVFSPDRSTIATSSYANYNPIRLWDVQGQSQLGSIPFVDGRALAFSADGSLLLIGGVSYDRTIQLWDLASLQQVGLLVGASGGISTMAFSPDGSMLAAGSYGGTTKSVFLWRFETQELIGVLGRYAANVGSVAFGPNGQFLAQDVYWEETIHLWDVEHQDELGLLTGHDPDKRGGTGGLAFTSNGKWLISGSRNGVELWELNLPGAIPIAFDPRPSDRGSGVYHRPVLQWEPGPLADQHDVYFSTTRDHLVDADHASSTYRGRQPGNSYVIPETLDWGQTYYWRIDEVNSEPDYTLFRGDVWSFEVEPLAYPIANVTATASSSHRATMGPEKTIDGSGLNDLDQHGIQSTDMWLSGVGDPNPWIQYEFDALYTPHELMVWNSNQLIETFVGLGAQDVVIETSIDGVEWTALKDTTQFSQAMGTAGYPANTTVDFQGSLARFVRMTVITGWGRTSQYGLSEVRFFHIPTKAQAPQPADGSVTDSLDVTLRWRPGRDATSHEILWSSDPTAIADGSAVVALVKEDSYTPDTLNFSTTYTWQINEVNDAAPFKTYTGDPWTFTTPPFEVVDDMEFYKDREFQEIWITWVDGYKDPANGSVVGNGPTGAPETSSVHGGNRSLPLHFDNTSALVSEATRTFDEVWDWTRFGIQTLTLHFAGVLDQAGNGRIYVKINETKTVYPVDLSVLAPGLWTQWTIDLAGLAADITRVETLMIGIEGAGIQGVVYVDDIRLHGTAPASESPQVLTWFEAESGAVTPPLEIDYAKPNVSGGAYIRVPDGFGNSPNGPTIGVATYAFTVREEGIYRLALRISAPPGYASSLWVRIPDMVTNTANHSSGWIDFDQIGQNLAWQWYEVYSTTDGKQVVEFTLSAGTHTLEIAGQRAHTLLDAIAVIR